MAKFKITQNPTFTVDVAIPQVGAVAALVPFEFKYRDRPALAALFDEWKAEAESLTERFKDNEPTISEITQAEIKQGANKIKDLVVSWGFEDELNDDNITALATSCVGVSDAIVKAYSDAYGKARLGN